MRFIEFETKANYDKVPGYNHNGVLKSTSFNPDRDLSRNADNVKAKLREIPDVIPLFGIRTGFRGEVYPAIITQTAELPKIRK